MVNSVMCAGAACPVVHFACAMKQAKGVAVALEREDGTCM